MKAKIYSLLPAIALITFGCNPIEDESLRDQYFVNAGTPITVEELNAAVSVTQPIPNTDDKVEGDQYVVLKNNRPDVGGAWHYETSTGVKITNSDNPTIIYTSNGEYDIYYEGVSANRIVRSKTFHINVTNCFDEWDNLFSGAENKADKSAKKTWEFWPGKNGNVYFNGMYANWLAADVYGVHDNATNAWGGFTSINNAGAYTMEFAFDSKKLIVYNPDGSVLRSGNYSFIHDVPSDEGISGFELGHPQNVAAADNRVPIMGQLITTVDLPGSQTAWNPSHTYWLWLIDEQHMAVVLPGTWKSADFWDVDAWYGYYQVKK